MDIFLLLQIIVLFAAIFLGVKLGGMGIGYAGGLGVVALTLDSVLILVKFHGMLFSSSCLLSVLSPLCN